MFLRRAASFIRRFRFPSPRLTAFRNSTLSSSTIPTCKTQFFPKNSVDSSWKNYHGNLALWITLSGQAAIVLGLCKHPVLAEDVNAADLRTGYDSGETVVTDLRRIEDGSVISNSHTVKWRIYTDNGRDLFLKGIFDEAENYFQSALHEAKEGFGVRDSHVAASCNNLAELYRVKKEFKKAEPLYLEAINILEESFGPVDIRVGAALHNLGQFYLVQRKLEEARQCYERALKIKGRVLGYAHTDYADTMYHLGTVLYLQGKGKDSEVLIRDSIRILEEGGLGESMTCLRRLKYLAQILLKSGRILEVENLQRKILHALELSKGWDSLDTVTAAESLALTLQSVGSLREAQELLERCLDVRKTVLHENHIQVGSNELHLARVAILSANQLRKVNISEATAELDKGKLLLDNSIRIASQVLNNPKEKSSSVWNSGVARETGKDELAAVVILLKSLDTLGLFEATKRELQDPTGENATPVEAEHALRQCIALFKEPRVRNLLFDLPDVKVEYLSCLKHLMSILSGNASEKQSRLLQELTDEVRFVEAELLSNWKHRS